MLGFGACDHGLRVERFANVYVNLAVVYSYPWQAFYHSYQRLAQQFLAEQLAWESVALEHFFVVDGDWDDAGVRYFAFDDGVENDVQDLKLGSQDFASFRAAAFDEKLDGGILSEQQFDVLVEDAAVKV